jgi:hypothetical protein
MYAITDFAGSILIVRQKLRFRWIFIEGAAPACHYNRDSFLCRNGYGMTWLTGFSFFFSFHVFLPIDDLRLTIEPFVNRKFLLPSISFSTVAIRAISRRMSRIFGALI